MPLFLLPELPVLMVAAVLVLAITGIAMTINDRRLVGRLPTTKIDRLEDDARSDVGERDRFAVTIGWGALHDSIRRATVRRSLVRSAGRSARLAAATNAVAVSVRLAVPALHDHMLAEQDRVWNERPAIGPITAVVVNLGLALPGDIALTNAAVLQMDKQLSVNTALPITAAMSITLFIASKLLARALIGTARRPGQAALSAGSIALVLGLTGLIRKDNQIRWMLFGLVPVAIAVMIAYLAHSPASSAARSARRTWTRRWLTLRHHLGRLERRQRRAVMARTSAMSRISGDIVALDHLARAGQPAAESVLTASVTSAYESMRRLGVIQGPDAVAAADRILTDLSSALTARPTPLPPPANRPEEVLL
jgi:hypothetical protein